MIIKIRKNNTKPVLLLYAVLWMVGGVSYAKPAKDVAVNAAILDDVVIGRSLKDPFDLKVQVPGLIAFFMQEAKALKERLQATEKKAPVVVEKPVVKPVEVPRAVVVPEPPVRLPLLQVSGIIFGTDHPVAVINGNVVDEGGVVDDVKVLKIGRGRIDVLYKGVVHVVQFNNE
jgi:hypothetical protein